jgi:hypothetical protein
LRDAYVAIAFRLFEAGIQRNHSPDEIALLRMGRVTLNIGLGRIAEARQECLAAQSSLPAGELWQADVALCEIDRETHNLAEAKMHIDKAIGLAPPEKQAVLRDLKRQLDGQ